MLGCGKRVMGRLFPLSSLSIATCYLVSTPTSNIIPLVRNICRRMSYQFQEFGTPFTDNYRVFFRNENGIISPFHDIPLMADEKNGVYNMVVEIPKWTNAKMEISTKDFMNPIKQDVKKGKMRFVKNSFPYKGYMWNYGAIPQTWEDPNITDEHTGQKGDGDPIDVCEIGYKVGTRGEIKQVKVLGVMALIDEGETDWKVIAIDVNDPLAEKLNDIGDVKNAMPGLLEATYDWFRHYKMPAGSPANEFAFNGEAKDKAFTVGVLNELHGQWKKLIMKNVENNKNLACENVAVADSPYKVTSDKANVAVEGQPELTKPADRPADVDMMYYLTAEQKK